MKRLIWIFALTFTLLPLWALPAQVGDKQCPFCQEYVKQLGPHIVQVEINAPDGTSGELYTCDAALLRADVGEFAVYNDDGEAPDCKVCVELKREAKERNRAKAKKQ